jgi:hypothetical protein
LTDSTRREALTTLSMTAAAGLVVAHTRPAAAQSVTRCWSDLLSDWVPDAKVRHRLLVDNPATLYDFPQGG